MSHHPAVAFVAPYRIYLPDEFFVVKLGAISARVKAVPLPPIASAGASQVHGQKVEIAHDIFGFAGRTQFFVVLDQVIDIESADWKADVCTRDHAIVATALQAVNRLLAVYRDQDVNRIGVASFHVIELVRADLSDTSLVVVDDDLNQTPGFVVSWPGYRSMGFGDTVDRESTVIDAIRTCLATNAEIPIERELLTSARNHLWRRQLRLVPVEANTAFESYTYSALKRAAPVTVLPESSDVIKKLQELEKLFARSATASSKQFSVWFDPAIQGWKGLLNAELRQWHGSCYELRNKVIHRGFSGVTDVEADTAIKHTRAAMNMINQCIADLIP